jgi:hypothetical protein
MGIVETRKRTDKFRIRETKRGSGKRINCQHYHILRAQEGLQLNTKCDNFGLTCSMNYGGSKMSLGEYMNKCIESTKLQCSCSHEEPRNMGTKHGELPVSQSSHHVTLQCRNKRVFGVLQIN